VTIIAAIGSIHNYPWASPRKSYFGKAPVVAQSESTLYASILTSGEPGPWNSAPMLFCVVSC